MWVNRLGEEGRFWQKSEHDFHHALDLPVSRYALGLHAPLGELLSKSAHQASASKVHVKPCTLEAHSEVDKVHVKPCTLGALLRSKCDPKVHDFTCTLGARTWGVPVDTSSPKGACKRRA
jgi:hypothetical protein